MCSIPLICYTCLTTEATEYFSLFKLDTDNLPLISKLKLCLEAIELRDDDPPNICKECLKSLQLAHTFIQLLITTQNTLKQMRLEPEIMIKEMKEEPYQQDLILQSDEINLKTEEVERVELIECEHCDMQFEKLWQKRKHYNRKHLTEKNHICSFCGKSFKLAYHLNEHVRAHSGEKTEQCQICDKKFHRVSSLRRHVKSHLSLPGQKSKRTPCLCTICGKNFPFSNGLQRHMRIHSGTKKYECDVCKKKFNQKTHLETHMRTHTGEKPYMCQTCGQGFALKSTLMKHRMTHHDEEGKRVTTFVNITIKGE